MGCNCGKRKNRHAHLKPTYELKCGACDSMIPGYLDNCRHACPICNAVNIIESRKVVGTTVLVGGEENG
jgi:hypothetical protein